MGYFTDMDADKRAAFDKMQANQKDDRKSKFDKFDKQVRDAKD